MLVFICAFLFYATQVSNAQDKSQLTDGKTRFYIPLSGVSLIPPAYFRLIEKDENVAFLHPGSFSSLQVKRIDKIPYFIFTESITQDVLKEQGVTLLEKKEITTYSNKPGTLVHVSFSMKAKNSDLNIEFERLMFFTGNYNETIWIDATYPLEAKSLLYNVLLHSILTVEF